MNESVTLNLNVLDRCQVCGTPFFGSYEEVAHELARHECGITLPKQEIAKLGFIPIRSEVRYARK
jgi:hypothetical protein